MLFVFRNDQRFKRAVPVTGNVYFSCAIVVQNERLCTMPVAAVTGMIACIVVLLVAEVFIHFGIQDAHQ